VLLVTWACKLRILPPALDELIEALGLLPGVGPRTAERYAYYLLRAKSDKASQLADKLQQLHGQVDYCPRTFALIEKGRKTIPALYRRFS
jgi:recombination protein RecR